MSACWGCGVRTFDVLFDGATFCLSGFGGAVRYVGGLARGMQRAGLHVGLLVPGPPKMCGLNLPHGAPIVDRPSPTRWWITEDPGRMDASPAERRGLIVHDVMDLDPTLDVPAENTFGGGLDDFDRACRAADLVITVSEATRHAVLGWVAGLDPALVHVVPHGLGDAFRPAVAGAGTMQDVVLHVGGRAGYKRFNLLIEAFAAAGLPGELVNVGDRATLATEEAAVVARVGLTGRVVCLGYVDDAALVGLYRGARVVVVASDCEGYGLPMREAVALGAPLVAPDLPVTDEAAGPAAHRFRPGDRDSLAGALRIAWYRPMPVAPSAVEAARAGWEGPAHTLELLLDLGKKTKVSA